VKCRACENYLCRPPKDHGLCGQCVKYMDIVNLRCPISREKTLYLKTCVKTITTLQSAGYEPIRYIGRGTCKKVFLVKQGNKEFAAKMSYGKGHFETHKEELETQKKFGDLALQAIEHFIIPVDDENDESIALVEIQEKVDTFKDVYNKTDRSDRWKLREDFENLKLAIAEKRLYIHDLNNLYDCAANTGYHNSELKVIDVGAAGELDS